MRDVHKLTSRRCDVQINSLTGRQPQVKVCSSRPHLLAVRQRLKDRRNLVENLHHKLLVDHLLIAEVFYHCFDELRSDRAIVVEGGPIVGGAHLV